MATFIVGIFVAIIIGAACAFAYVVYADDSGRTGPNHNPLDFIFPRTSISSPRTSIRPQQSDEAADGVDAIEKAQQLKPDLIVLDVAMPRMNGVEAASVLKGLMPDVPIVWFTMYRELMGHSLTAAVGVDAVLSKPDGVGGLVECVQGLLS